MYNPVFSLSFCIVTFFWIYVCFGAFVIGAEVDHFRFLSVLQRHNRIKDDIRRK